MTIPLFGGRRAIRVRAGSRSFASGIDTLADSPLKDCRIVIEAGELRPESPLRKACERAKTAVAIGCYPDGERDLAKLIDDELRVSNLRIAPDARASLMALLGGDRQASRNELRKLDALCPRQGRGHARRRDGGGRRRLRTQDRSDRRRRLRRKAGPGRNRIRQGDGRRHLSRHDHFRRPAPGGVAAQIGARGGRGNAGRRPCSTAAFRGCIFRESQMSKPRCAISTRRGWCRSSNNSQPRRWRCASRRRWRP